MLYLLTAAVLCASLYDVYGQAHYSYSHCTSVPVGTKQYNANITLSSYLQITKIGGGVTTYTSDDGLFMEVTGTEVDANNNVCINITGTTTDMLPPVIHVVITPVLKSSVVRAEESGNARVRRDQTVFHLSTFPVTTNVDTLLKGFEPYHDRFGDDSLSGSTKHSSTGSLAVHYIKGSYSQTHSMKGVGWYTRPTGLPNNNDDLILKYDLYFENFGFGKMGKLPGLYGGVSGDGAYGCGGGQHPTTCFSLRLMWRESGAGELYAYIPTNQEPGFNDRPDVIANAQYGNSIGRGKIHFQNGVWQTVTEQVHLNTIGKTDGWVKFCNEIRGQSQQCYTASNLRMRNSADHHIRGIDFSTFFGGSQPEDAAPNDCHTYYKEIYLIIPDNVVVG